MTALGSATRCRRCPDGGYGWEKLFSEQMCQHFPASCGLPTRIARFHNVYGPYGTYGGGREKAPAASAARSPRRCSSGNHEIEVWGDGEQTRSFTYIEDCVEGIVRITADRHASPLNLGSSELVTINQLVALVEEAAGITSRRRYDLSAPVGVRGRNSDNALIRERLGWEPARRYGTGSHAPTPGSASASPPRGQRSSDARADAARRPPVLVAVRIVLRALGRRGRGQRGAPAVPLDGRTQAVLQRRGRAKAEALPGEARVQAAARLAVGPRVVPADLAREAHQRGEQLSQLADADLLSGAEVHGLGIAVALARQHDRSRAVLDVQKLP